MAPRDASYPEPAGRGELTETPENLQNSRVSPTICSTIRRGLKSFKPTRRTMTVEAQDTWGPLGLTLLHSPSDPVIDLIFVHGLRGGSIKTWCKSEDLRLFWPQTWLPRAADFENARIHSYGYDSNWVESKGGSSDLNGFGRLLLGELAASPVLGEGEKTPIILVGHSMGGLVMKKAYIFARQDEQLRELAMRIRGMFFLATPHRGSEHAKLLGSLLRASGVFSPRQYIADLTRNSIPIAAINDDFRYFADDLQIWSFYETVKTRTGISSAILVERDSAIIGTKREMISPVNADHRNICKFDSPSDPNYIFIRNSLVKAAKNALSDVRNQRAGEVTLRMNALETFLHVIPNAEDDLNAIESRKTEGSCVWVTTLQSFRDWRDNDDEPLSCYWLTGQPGAGKQNAQQTVSSLLRSLAFQMATIHTSVRKTLFAMEEAAVRFDKDDERAIWRKLFINGILENSISTTQYWVVDGLDECIDPERLFFLLQRFSSTFSVKILFTSRRLPDLEMHVARFRHRVYRHHISAEETTEDIKRFVENNSDKLPVNAEDRPALAERLVRQSDGGFLWIELALEGLRRVFIEKDIDTVLDGVPAGMAALYNRILESMAKDQQQITLTKAILEWTVCGTQPLRTAELQAILSYDLNSDVRNVEATIDELCGQLFHINNDVVRLIHATARNFLLSEEANPIFRLNKADTNEHLATVCLRYLTSSEMKPPAQPGLVSKPVSRSPFLDYACTSFSEHFAASSPTSDQLFLLLDKFLRGNVLSWVEYILRAKRSVYYLTRTSRDLRIYLDRRGKHALPLDDPFENIDGWRADLSRIASKYGIDLRGDPSAVHFILPALCPTNTRIHRQFYRPNRMLRLSGITNSSWDDCIFYIEYQQSRALSVAGGDDMFAIGMKSGAVQLYQQSTCAKINSLDHGEPVRFLKFSNGSRFLASAGYSQVKMWSANGELVWQSFHKVSLSTISFTEKDENLLVANDQGKIMGLSVGDGTRSQGYNGNEDQTYRPRGISQVVDICPRGELLAFACHGNPPQIWSIQDDVMISSYHLARDELGVLFMSAVKVLFNPNPAIELLAVSYQDGELAIFNTWISGNREIKSLAAEAFTLASTSDGRTLASGDAHGMIKIFDFESLTLLYCIKSADHAVRGLAFSADGFRLYDIRETKTRVWEPAVPLTKTSNEELSDGDPVAVSVPVIGRDRDFVDIAQIIAPPDTGCVFAVRNDGSVVAYDWNTGDMISTLYSHRRGRSVTNISWNHSMIATAGDWGEIKVHALARMTSAQPWASAGKQFETELETKLNGRIQGIFLHPHEPWLLVLQTKQSTVIDMRTGDKHPLPSTVKDDYRAWVWLSRISPSNLLLGARPHSIDIYKIDSLDSEWQARHWQLTRGGHPVAQPIERLVTDKSEKYLAVLLDVPPQSPQSALRLLVYDTAHIGLIKDEALPCEPILAFSADEVRTFLGFYRDKVVYLDYRLWVRAVDINKAKITHTSGPNAVQPERYSFIPQEIIVSNNGVDGLVTDAGTVVFPKEGELAVVRNLFEWPFQGEPVESCDKGVGKAPLLSR